MRPAVVRPVAQRLSAGHAVLRVDPALFPGPRAALALPGAWWHGQASCGQAFCTLLGLPIAAARAAAPRERLPWLAPRALMRDRRRISEGLRGVHRGYGGVQGGYGRSSSGVLVRRETLQLAVDPHALNGASVDPFGAHVCVRPDVEKPLGGGVTRERLVELESDGARHHVWADPRGNKNRLRQVSSDQVIREDPAISNRPGA